MINKTNLKPFFCIALIFVIFNGCKKESEKLPYSYANFTIDLSDPEYIELNNIGGAAVVTGGYYGIVIYRNNLEEFKAYDRACLHDFKDKCRVSLVDGSFSDVKCECCNSTYSLSYGNPIDGPASRGLKEYKTHFNGESLSVSN